MGQNPGNDRHSGPQTKAATGNQRKKRSKENGKTNWKKMAEDLMKETEHLRADLDSSRRKYQELRKRFVKVEKASMDERAVVKLRCLNHLYGRLVNFQASCDEDKARVDALVKDAQHVMKDQIQKATRPK